MFTLVVLHSEVFRKVSECFLKAIRIQKDFKSFEDFRDKSLDRLNIENISLIWHEKIKTEFVSRCDVIDIFICEDSNFLCLLKKGYNFSQGE